VRVHPEYLKAERIPAPLVTKHVWEERFEDINAHERYLTRNGVVIRKFSCTSPKRNKRDVPVPAG